MNALHIIEKEFMKILSAAHNLNKSDGFLLVM